MASQNQEQQQTPPPPPGPLKCPRCDSSNTKFCYYNNYSFSQPRHFCKACKHYWTHGGTLRNVPVGGGCRKNKRVNKKHLRAQTETPSTSVSTKNPNPNPLINLPSTSSSELNSLIYASFWTAAAYDDNNIGGLVIPSNQLSSGVINLHQTSANFLTTNEYPSFKFGSLDAAPVYVNANLGLKSVKVEGIESNINAMGNNISNDMDLWQANYQFDQALNVVASDSSYMCWNPPMA